MLCIHIHVKTAHSSGLFVYYKIRKPEIIYCLKTYFNINKLALGDGLEGQALEGYSNL